MTERQIDAIIAGLMGMIGGLVSTGVTGAIASRRAKRQGSDALERELEGLKLRIQSAVSPADAKAAVRDLKVFLTTHHEFLTRPGVARYFEVHVKKMPAVEVRTTHFGLGWDDVQAIKRDAAWLDRV